jgi:hypothetical protein
MALLALDDARRQAEEIRALPLVPLEDRLRFDRMAGLGAGPASAVIALQRRERAVSKRLISTLIDDRLLSICQRGVK